MASIPEVDHGGAGSGLGNSGGDWLLAGERIPYERAILRSHYFGRTFILPTHDARAQGVRLKLSVNRELVAGKRLLLGR